MSVTTQKKSETPVIEESRYEPTGLNTCDACGVAKAYVRVSKTKGRKQLTLELCSHHFTKHHPKLIAGNWAVEDRTDLLEKETNMYKQATDDKF